MKFKKGDLIRWKGDGSVWRIESDPIDAPYDSTTIAAICLDAGSHSSDVVKHVFNVYMPTTEDLQDMYWEYVEDEFERFVRETRQEAGL